MLQINPNKFFIKQTKSKLTLIENNGIKED